MMRKRTLMSVMQVRLELKVKMTGQAERAEQDRKHVLSGAAAGS
jgi:hypothetical protein